MKPTKELSSNGWEMDPALMRSLEAVEARIAYLEKQRAMGKHGTQKESGWGATFPHKNSQWKAEWAFWGGWFRALSATLKWDG